MRSFVLVDYDNLPQRLVTPSLVSLATAIDTAVCRVIPGTTEMNIRLYGGWYATNGLSRKGTLLAQEISANFPIIRSGSGGGTRRHIHCSIAASLVAAHALVLHATLRTRRGVRKVRCPTHPANCADPSTCTVGAVLGWATGQCPNPTCTITSRDAFLFDEQKLVDTLLCCDLITLTQSNTPQSVILLSEDDDFIPALLLGGLRSNYVWHLRTRAGRSRMYDSHLMQIGINISSL
jgi:hypothetical protein